MKAITYKFRAECIVDVNRFLERFHHPYSLKIQRQGKYASMPDVVVEFRTSESLEKIISIFNRVNDSHVMLETIMPKKLYTGIRKGSE